MSKPLLVIIDMLEDFFLKGTLQQARPQLTHSINQLIAYARKNGFPVLWVRQEFESDLSDAFLAQKKENIFLTIKGTKGVKLLNELDRRSDDLEVIKKRYSAFYNTDLDNILDQIRPSKLIIAGVNTHACVRMTAIDAYQRDIEVIVVADCVLSNDPEHHRVTLDYMDGHICQVLSLDELVH
jgi:nicotinamidase-related amidase